MCSNFNASVVPLGLAMKGVLLRTPMHMLGMLGMLGLLAPR